MTQVNHVSGVTMLPDTILGRWLSTRASLADVKSSLSYHVEAPAEDRYHSGTCSFHWIERTMFTISDSNWAKAEGSLIFENKRAVLWRPDAADVLGAHVIVIAMFSSSL